MHIHVHVLYVDLLYIYNICLFVDSTYLFWPTKTLVIWYIDSELLELMPKGNVRWNCLWERFFQSTWGCYKPKYIVFFSIYIIIHLHLNNIQTTNCTSIYQWHIEFVNRLQLNYLSCTRFVMNRLSLFSSFNLGHLCCVLSFCSIVSFAQVQQAHTFCDKEKLFFVYKFRKSVLPALFYCFSLTIAAASLHLSGWKKCIFRFLFNSKETLVALFLSTQSDWSIVFLSNNHLSLGILEIWFCLKS